VEKSPKRWSKDLDLSVVRLLSNDNPTGISRNEMGALELT